MYAVLRRSHTILAYLLFLTFLGHLSAALFHTMVLQDGLLSPHVVVESRVKKIGKCMKAIGFITPQPIEAADSLVALESAEA